MQRDSVKMFQLKFVTFTCWFIFLYGEAVYADISIINEISKAKLVAIEVYYLLATSAS